MSPSPRTEAIRPQTRAPGRAPAGAQARSRALDALLCDLGPRLRRGEGPREAPPPRLATGLADLDALLGGGFARGHLSEIAGPPGSGRTSLALALLAGVTRAQELGVVVDAADSFDPASAACAGVELERVLWVRPPGLREALRSAERMLEVGGFGLVLLDLAAPELCVPRSAWSRLSRAAAATNAALVAVSTRRGAGSSAELAVEMRPPRARFSDPPLLLEALEIEAALVRHRALPDRRSACLRLRPGVAA